MSVVLDASAILAYLFQEKGQDIVAEVIEDCLLSTVNLTEVLSRFVRDGHDPTPILREFRSTTINIIPFDEEQSLIAAALIPATSTHGLSLGDRACLSLALAFALTAVTADHVWQGLDIGVEIRVIR